MIRNTTLPPRVRAEAQLQLTQMHCYTRGTQIRNRCVMGGKARGIFRDFKMTRVRTHSTTPYPFSVAFIRSRKAALHCILLTRYPVQLPIAGHGRKSSGCKEGKLVNLGLEGRSRRMSHMCRCMMAKMYYFRQYGAGSAGLTCHG